MKPKTLILIIAAVGCGLAASYMTSRLLAERNQEAAAEPEKVAVLVAKQKIAMGTLVKNPEQFFIVKEFVKGQEPKKALSKFEDIKDKRLNKPLGTEQFVTTEDLIDSKNGDLPAMLPAGMRAIAIRANLETSTGFVLPSTRVDLSLVVRKGDHDSWSRIIMQNMLVMAVDVQRTRDPEKDHIIPSVVTLAATPEEAEKLAMAQAMGEIRLLLRPFGEEQAVNTRGSRPIDVARNNSKESSGVKEGEGTDFSPASAVNRLPAFPESKPGEKPTIPVPIDETPPPPKTHTMVIYNGESVTKAVYVTDHKGEVSLRDVDRQEMSPRPERSAPVREPAPQPPKPQPAPTSQEPPQARK